MAGPTNRQLGEQADIVINARLKLDAAIDKKKSLVDPIKKNMSAIQNEMSATKLKYDIDKTDLKKKLAGLQDELSRTPKAKKGKGVLGYGATSSAEHDKLKSQIKTTKSDLNSLTESYTKQEQVLRGGYLTEKKKLGMVEAEANKEVAKSDKNYKKQRTNMDRMKNDVLKNSVRFKGWAMSLMFFGMALLRVSKMINQFGTKAFREINESVEGSVNGFQMMEGTMKYLGFTIGQALEPLIMNLIPIVDKLAEFISTHPGLTRVSIIILTIAGTFFMLLGTLALAAGGLKEFGMVLGATGKLSKGLRGIKLAKKDQDTFYKLGKYLNGTFKSAMKWISNHKMQLKAGGMLAAIAFVMVMIVKMGKRMGSFGDLAKAVWAGIKKSALMGFVAPIKATLDWLEERKRRLELEEQGITVPKTSLWFMYKRALSSMDDGLEPYDGAYEQSMSIADIWNTEILPDFLKAKEVTDELGDNLSEVAESLKDVSFSMADITNLAGKGLLNEESMGAILYADKINPNTVDDKTEQMLAALLKNEGTTQDLVIHELTVNSDADNITAILESIKSYV